MAAIRPMADCVIPWGMDTAIETERLPEPSQPENRPKPVGLPALRRPNGRFAPGGPSGNPGGRPKIVGNVQALARAHTAEAVATLVEIMRDQDAPAAARAASANAILDRGWGRAPVSVTVDNGVIEAQRAATERMAEDFRRIAEHSRKQLLQHEAQGVVVEVDS